MNDIHQVIAKCDFYFSGQLQHTVDCDSVWECVVLDNDLIVTHTAFEILIWRDSMDTHTLNSENVIWNLFAQGHKIIYVMEDGNVSVFDTSTFTITKKHPVGYDIRKCEFSAPDKIVIMSYNFEIDTCIILNTYHANFSYLLPQAIVTVEDSKISRLWNIHTGKIMGTSVCRLSFVHVLQDRRFIGLVNGRLGVFKKWRDKSILLFSRETIVDIDVSDNIVATCTINDQIKVWDIVTKKCIKIIDIPGCPLSIKLIKDLLVVEFSTYISS